MLYNKFPDFYELNLTGENMKKLLLLVVASAAAFAPVAHAEEENPGIAVSLKAGTLGAGVELDYAFNKNFNVRVQLNSFTYDDSFDEDGITYSGDLELKSVGLLADWRPFSGVFKLTGGAYKNDNKISAAAVSNGDAEFEIGDYSYAGSASDPLTLAANMDLGNGTAGYLGFGWGNSYSSGFSFSLDIGVLFSGSAQASIAASGTAYRVDNPDVQFDVAGSSAEAQMFRDEIEAERRNLQGDLDEFEYYPVISIGLGYRF